MTSEPVGHLYVYSDAVRQYTAARDAHRRFSNKYRPAPVAEAYEAAKLYLDVVRSLVDAILWPRS